MTCTNRTYLVNERILASFCKGNVCFNFPIDYHPTLRVSVWHWRPHPTRRTSPRHQPRRHPISSILRGRNPTPLAWPRIARVQRAATIDAKSPMKKLHHPHLWIPLPERYISNKKWQKDNINCEKGIKEWNRRSCKKFRFSKRFQINLTNDLK